MEEEHKKLRKQRAIKVMLTEILMFFSVILLVVFLTLIVLGYNFNINKIGTEEVIERVGLIQVASTPSGATVMVDGEEGDLFSRTNYSKTLSVGEHLISLKRDGFDTWEKKVNISEGLLFRVSYPRLFLKEREREEILSFSKEEEEGFKEIKFSKDGTNLSLTNEEGAVFNLDLNEGKKPALKEVKSADLETEEKIKAEEALKLEKKLKEIREKLSLGAEEKIELGEYLGEEYVVVYGKEVKEDNGVTEGEEKTEEEEAEKEIETEAETVRLYRGGDLDSEIIKAIFEKKVEFKISKLEFRGKGQLIFIYGETEEGEKKEVYYDFETGEFRENKLEEGELWLDEYLKYKISEEGILVWDFDGENRRELVKIEVDKEGEKSEKIVKEFGVKISMNNRYLYYFIREAADGVETVKLVREKII